VAALKGCWEVGERPTLAEIKAYTLELWDRGPSIRRAVIETWRTILKPPHRKFRALRWQRRHEPLYRVDRVSEDHSLEPTEARLGRVLVQAAEALAVAQASSPEDVLAARVELEAAMAAVHRLQRLRVGTRLSSERFDDPARRPRWW
jgi:hypothetical protein